MATSYSRFTAKMKVKLCLFIFYLSFQALVAPKAIKESHVAKYFIQRKFDKGDVFRVVFKQECTKNECSPSDKTKFCNDLSADSIAPVENFKYSCSCKYASGTFLPEKGKCAKEEEASEHLKGKQTLQIIGCSQYLLSWKELFLKAFDLNSNGTYRYYVANFQSCKVIPGSPVFYDSLQGKWKRIRSEIFSIRFQKIDGIFLEWKADTNKELSGRILRLIVTCNYTTASQQPLKGCLLFKAVGDVTYNYLNKSVIQESGCPSATMSSLVPTESSLPPFPSVTSSLLSSPSSSLSSSSSSSSTSLSSSATTSSSSLSTSLSSSATATTVPVSQETIITTSLAAINTNVFSVHPSKSSSSTDAASSSAVINGPGGKKRQTDGNDNGVVIGAAVGGAVVFGIFLIVVIVFYKRRKLSGKSKEKATKLEVKNPVYGKSDNDIQMAKTRGKQVLTSNDDDNQPTYQGLSIDGAQINGAALYSSPEDNYDNYTTYQSLDKNIPGSPVYQSLKKGQAATGHPNTKSKPSTTGQPVYNVLKQPGTEQGNTEESLYNVLEGPDAEKDYEAAERDNHGDTQDPLYNVLDGPDAEQNYEAVNVGNASADPPLYNVVEGPESTQDRQEPLYNVLDSLDAENSLPGRQGPYHGSNNEPLYNVVEGPDSGEPNKSSADYATPNGPPDGQDNPAYEQTLGFDAPYASVHRPGPQRESVYEPLRGPDRHDLYEPLNKRGT